jgi:hypothetical protein
MLDPAALTLEMTEGSLMQNVDLTAASPCAASDPATRTAPSTPPRRSFDDP